MSRNKVAANTVVFKKLESILIGDVSGLAVGPRWIKTNPFEQDSLINASIDCRETCLPGKTAFAISLNSRSIFALPESPTTHSLPFMNGITGQVNDAGLLTAIWAEPETKVKEIPDIASILANNIFGRNHEYGLDEVVDYFQDISLWEADPNTYPTTLPGSIYRVYGGFLTVNQSLNLSLPYLASTLTKIRQIFEQFSGCLIEEAVFRGLTATHWDHAFLEFYRCIERLYSVPYIEKFRSNLSAVRHLDVNLWVSSALNWRPKEEDALVCILNDLTDRGLVIKLATVLSVNSSATPTDITTPVGKALYKVRNNIAHLRINTNSISIQWNILIDIMCDVIIDRYSAYRSMIVP